MLYLQVLIKGSYTTSHEVVQAVDSVSKNDILAVRKNDNDGVNDDDANSDDADVVIFDDRDVDNGV